MNLLAPSHGKRAGDDMVASLAAAITLLHMQAVVPYSISPAVL